uniref:Uncharacterized protein n=1 Tax=Arundo donax TaxID=35708 RepID=A0A0A9CDQ2_ARUDO
MCIRVDSFSCKVIGLGVCIHLTVSEKGIEIVDVREFFILLSQQNCKVNG